MRVARGARLGSAHTLSVSSPNSRFELLRPRNSLSTVSSAHWTAWGGRVHGGRERLWEAESLALALLSLWGRGGRGAGSGALSRSLFSLKLFRIHIHTPGVQSRREQGQRPRRRRRLPPPAASPSHAAHGRGLVGRGARAAEGAAGGGGGPPPPAAAACHRRTLSRRHLRPPRPGAEPAV